MSINNGFNLIFESLKLDEAKADQEKFLTWAGKDLYQRFFKMRARLKNKDIYYWMKQDKNNLISELDKLDQSQTRKEKDAEAKAGAKLIYNDKNWEVYEINSYEASAKYGKNTKWCISGSKLWSSSGDGRSYFNSYKKQGFNFVFFIDIANNTKYALSYKPQDLKNYEIFNAEDISIPYIPDAPIIKSLKIDYWTFDDIKVVANAVAAKKLPEDILLRVITDTLEDHTGSEYAFYTKAEIGNFIKHLQDTTPKAFIDYFKKADYENLPFEQQIKLTDNYYGEMPLNDIVTPDNLSSIFAPEYYKGINYICTVTSDYDSESADFFKTWADLIRECTTKYNISMANMADDPEAVYRDNELNMSVKFAFIGQVATDLIDGIILGYYPESALSGLKLSKQYTHSMMQLNKN